MSLFKVEILSSLPWTKWCHGQISFPLMIYCCQTWSNDILCFIVLLISNDRNQKDPSFTLWHTIDSICIINHVKKQKQQQQKTDSYVWPCWTNNYHYQPLGADDRAAAKWCNRINFWKYPRQGCPWSYLSQVLAGFSVCGEPHLARKAFAATATYFLSTRDNLGPHHDIHKQPLYCMGFTFLMNTRKADWCKADELIFN